jgi:ribosomal protein L35
MKKSNTQKRKLSQTVCVSPSDSKPIKLMLPY